MKPYLAIIKDSFREALASRVLWVLLILITLLILGLVPLGYRQELATELERRDLVNPLGLVQRIQTQHESGKPTPGRRIWSLWEDKTKQELQDALADPDALNERPSREVSETVRQALNELIENRQLYLAEDWQEVSLSEALLAELDEMSAADREITDVQRNLNRQLLDQTYPGFFEPLPNQLVVLTYFGLSISPQLPIGKDRVDTIIETVVLPFIMSGLLGFIGLLVAVLVTSPIIPLMFDAGSLNLLLSKPVSRSLLFLSKFIGGCAFIFINIAYIVVGLWLIAGLRYGIWNHRLLLCIPIFVFLFAIYYSVSAFAGIIWRNAVICVVAAALLWVMCFTVGVTKGIFDVAINNRRLVSIYPLESELFAVDDRAILLHWEGESATWQQVFDGSQGNKMLGPVFDDQRRVVAAQTFRGNRLFSSPEMLVAERDEGKWEEEFDGPTLPFGAIQLLPDPQGSALLVTTSDVFRVAQQFESADKKISLLFMELPTLDSGPFKPVGPRPKIALTSPADAAIDATSGKLALYSGGRLMILDPDDEGTYQQGAQVELDVDREIGAALAFSQDTILLAFGDGQVWDIDAEQLDVRSKHNPEPKSQPRFLYTNGGQSFAIVFQNYKLQMYDTRQRQFTVPNISGQEDISGVGFSDQNTLLVADRARRVSTYDMASWEQTEQHTPPLATFEMIYYYVIRPVYNLFPKPGELGNTVQYALQGKETSDFGIQFEDLQSQRPVLDPWRPVRSSAVFTLVVLALACLYLERQEF